MKDSTRSAVVHVFALFFSGVWIRRWQAQWPAPSPGGTAARAPARSQTSRRGVRPRSARRAAAGPVVPLRFYERIFSLRVTLWYLLFQRLDFDGSQAAVIQDIRRGGADRLGRCGRQKLSRKIRSTRTSAYNQARQRLPLELLWAALAQVRQRVLRLVGLNPTPGPAPAAAQRPRQLIDGSTIAMLATPELARRYPPARNQRGASDWCLMRIVVGFCARSGAVLSAIEGAVQQSEQMLAWALMRTAAAFTVWIGDRNFGVWSVISAAVQGRQDVVVRLTAKRARKLAGPSRWRSGQQQRVTWQPSRHDQVPPGSPRQGIVGRLIYVRVRRGPSDVDLWLFTTLLDAQAYPIQLLVQWYGQRWQAELNFRSVKTQLRMESLDVVSPEMARKEFYAGVLAYSLVRVVMWGAGQRLEAGVQCLSFSQARRMLLDWLQDWGRAVGVGAGSAARWVASLLDEVTLHTLPRRRRRRASELRRVRHRRLKFPPLIGSRKAARKRCKPSGKSW
jgi:hypothetical protein